MRVCGAFRRSCRALSLFLLLGSSVWAQPTFREADLLFNRGQYQRARELYLQLGKRYSQEGDRAGAARALEGLASVSMVQGDPQKARSFYTRLSRWRREKTEVRKPTGDQLVIGGGFEQGLVPPWGTGHYESGNFNFGLWWNSGGCRSFAKSDSEVAYRGTESLRITNLSPPGNHVFGTSSQRLRGIKPNTIYEVTVWAKGEDLKPGAIQFVMDAGWSLRPLTLPSGSYDWTRASAQFNSGDLSFLDLRILTLDSGTVWLDELSLREVPQGEVPADGLLAAEALFRKGRVLQALEAYGKLPDTPSVQLRRAEALALLGRFGEALELYETFPSSSAEAGLAAGEIYLRLGQVEQAIPRFEAVYKAAEEDQFTRARAADRLAAASLRKGELNQAIAWQGEALRVMSHINDPHGRAESLYHLAEIHYAGQQFLEAARRLRESLPLARVTGDKVLESEILTLAGALFRRESRREEALRALEKAVVLKRENFDHYGLVQSLLWQGLVLEELGRKEKALQSLREAAEILEELGRTATGIAQARKSLLAQYGELYEALIRISHDLGLDEEALEALNRGRNLELTRVFQKKASSLNELDRELVAQAQVLEAEKGVLEASLREQLSRPEEERDEERLNETRQEREKRRREYREFLRSLFQEHPELAGLLSVHPKQLRLKQKSLGPEQAIVEYLCGEEQLYIFLVTERDLVVRVVDFPRAEVESTLRSLQLATLREAREEELKGERAAQLSHELYEKLLEPILPQLKGVERLAILPNGPLHYLPFQMLAVDPEGKEHLVDRLACLNLCEESFLSPSGGQSSLRKLLLLANPDGSLGAAEREVKGIAAMFPESEVYLGQEAGKDKLYEAGQGFEGLHIATHGVFDEQNAADSYLQLAVRDSDSGSRLTVGEVWGMDLEGLDLVTLSACLTGWGEENPGDDLIGLENAFLYAGARSVVASLWSVDDQATSLLMTEFYSRLKEGEERAEALRGAQLEVKKRFSQPYFWAPFILVGPN